MAAALLWALGGCAGIASIDGGAPDAGKTSIACADAEPILQAGTSSESGFVRCDDGFVHRERAVQCLEPQGVGDDDCRDASGCQNDDDCTAEPFGRCERNYPWGCSCSYGCRSDDDCQEGRVCACAGVAGERARCVASSCRTSDGCGEGLCGLSMSTGVCGESYASMACLTSAAPCRVDGECGGERCPETSYYAYQEEEHQQLCRIYEDEWQCRYPSHECDGPCG